MPKILIVEDDTHSRNGLSELLRGEGYTVVVAEDVETAVKRVAHEDVDLLLCDLDLPDGSGLDLLKSTRNQYPELAYVVMTASTTQESYQEAAGLGVAGWLTKPLDIDDLLALLKNALTEKESEIC